MPEYMRRYIEEMEDSSESKIAVHWVPNEGYNYLENEFSRHFNSSLTPWVWEEIERLQKIQKSY